MNKFEYIKNELIFDNLLVNLASLPSFIKIDMLQQEKVQIDLWRILIIKSPKQDFLAIKN